MKLPRYRFTLRRLMVAVAIVGLIFGGIQTTRRRSTHFQALADYHWGKCPSRLGGYDTPHYKWHLDQATQYRLAAIYPWRIVTAQTPPPLKFDEQPCLCIYRFSSGNDNWRQSVDLMCEYFQRDGWELSCGERMDGVAGVFDAYAEKGKAVIKVEATTEASAWRKLFEQIGH